MGVLSYMGGVWLVLQFTYYDDYGYEHRFEAVSELWE